MRRPTVLTALALASAFALAGCANGSEQPAETPGERASVEPSTTAGESSSISSEHNEQDVMFAQMMTPHHQQAVEMSEMLLAKDDIPTEVADFAQQVIDAQGPEIERMNAMLEAWGEEPGDMEGMDHGSGMGGMMSEAAMAALEEAQGTEAAQLYLEQMITHHQGAVEMAQEQLDSGENPEALQLAQQIIDAQEAEIAQMEDMLQNL
ncbi:DUF305 domain-containing protein [Agrococcus sp. ARC_14]|uniref:DUF305 domain-containing protein n=1 Tax=Agrococcus sp. ARC_14 TaxID=2919927 RepID=UPI001F06F902|nr:DUF305 domain-containing protein [Agrococcus sp. ARC_14]MCH1882856.1 DUF305 domain-containing protein [Agrococcus sp. ARC_14]